MEQTIFLGLDAAELVLILLNLLLGLAFALPLARHLRALAGPPHRVRRYVLELLGLYLIESLALALAMGIPILGVGLAVVWGVILGDWLRNRADHGQARRTAERVAAYSCLPIISLLAVPVVFMLAGLSVVSLEQAKQIGIPGFLPGPLKTILGFYALPAVLASILKIAITTGEAHMLVRLHEKREIAIL